MLNAAIVGLGRWGQVLVESVQGKSDAIRFTAGITRTPANAADFTKKHGLTLGSDYAAMLMDPSIDAVVLATPHQQHAEQIVAACKARKHIFVEKPFTLTKASAVTSVAAADKAGLVLALGHNRRFLPSVLELKSRLESGALGTILHAESNHSGFSGLRFKPGNWRTSREESPAGGMGAMGIHMLDMLINLFGRIEDVRSVSLRRAIPHDIDDTTSMIFRFESGMTGYLATLAATAQTQRIEVFGTKGSIEIRNETYFTFRPIEGKPEHTDYPRFDKERAELEAFAAAISGKAPYPLPTADAIHGVAVFEAIVKSAETNKAVAVK
ncbi:MAG: gfo/Idh/MocA family oxidoreductase [Alphaproteobacteria bacterium]|nr:gfo/Idh/MocA family oxidoreductase [Alphaproteobacteria bacterium]